MGVVFLIVIIVVGLLVGALAGLNPRDGEVLISQMRLCGRKLGFAPKVVPVPAWLADLGAKHQLFMQDKPANEPLFINEQNKPKKMISVYTLIDDRRRLPKAIYVCAVTASQSESQGSLTKVDLIPLAAQDDKPTHAVYDLPHASERMSRTLVQTEGLSLEFSQRLAKVLIALTTQANSITVYMDDLSYTKALGRRHEQDMMLIEEDLKSLLIQLKAVFDTVN